MLSKLVSLGANSRVWGEHGCCARFGGGVNSAIMKSNDGPSARAFGTLMHGLEGRVGIRKRTLEAEKRRQAEEI